MSETPFVGTPRKATTHTNQNEGLIFEKSSPGKKAYRMDELDVPAIDAAALLGDTVRTDGLGRHAGAERDRDRSPLHAPVHLELRHRSRHVPARLAAR